MEGHVRPDPGYGGLIVARDTRSGRCNGRHSMYAESVF